MLRHFCDETDVDFYTRLFITKYGIDKVRGGTYSQLELSKQDIYDITHYPVDMHLTCNQCSMKGHKRHLCPFLRNSFDKKDTIVDIDDDSKNIEDIQDVDTKKNVDCNKPSFVSVLLKSITYPVKIMLNRFYNHNLNSTMSMRMGRSGSFHRLYQFDIKSQV